MLVAEEDVSGARVNLFGEVRRFEASPEMREAYLTRHPEARQWVEFGDFAFYRMEVANVYYVGGFGEMGWVPAGGYRGLETPGPG